MPLITEIHLSLHYFNQFYLKNNQLRFFYFLRYFQEVRDATSSPPKLPPSGPKSIIQSAVLITSKLCSIMHKVLPLSRRRCKTFNNWFIDLGPEGGNLGGELVASGPPENISKNKKSATGYFLNKILK